MGQKGYIIELGLIDYGKAWELQHDLWSKRVAGELPDLLLLLEHPHVITLGRRGSRSHLLASAEALEGMRIPIFNVERGGDITYHGPGQLVCYPILNLKEGGYSYHRYPKMLESVIIRALSAVGVRAFRERGQAGVWVFARRQSPALTSWPQQIDTYIAQIAAIGVKVNQQDITSHGFAINVNPNLDYFKHIIPCGIEGCQVTSLRQVTGRPITVAEMLEPVIRAFSEIFEMEPVAHDDTAGLEPAMAMERVLA